MKTKKTENKYVCKFVFMRLDIVSGDRDDCSGLFVDFHTVCLFILIIYQMAIQSGYLCIVFIDDI